MFIQMERIVNEPLDKMLFGGVRGILEGFSFPLNSVSGILLI